MNEGDKDSHGGESESNGVHLVPSATFIVHAIDEMSEGTVIEIEIGISIRVVKSILGLINLEEPLGNQASFRVPSNVGMTVLRMEADLVINVISGSVADFM